MLVTASLLLGWLLVSFHSPHQRDPLAIGEIAIPQIDTPTVVNVKDKTALYIGDSSQDTHQFTGSVLAPNITGSLLGSSSYAETSSLALIALTSSYKERC